MRVSIRVAGVIVGMVTAVLVVAPIPASAAPAVPAAGVHAADVASDTVLGRRLVNRFMSMLQHKDVAGLEAFLSIAFQIVRSNGTAATKTEYLADLPDVTAFRQYGFHVTRSGDTLVVRNTAVVSVAVEGQHSSAEPAPRLSVFERNARTGAWQMVAHANFVPFS